VRDCCRPEAAQGTEEFDSYKLRVAGYWVYSTPTGTLQGSADTDIGAIDLTKDLHFNTYSTFFGKLDWKFTHKTISIYLEAGSLPHRSDPHVYFPRPDV
jgi:hypothetical protein